MRPTLTLCLIARDEEPFLAACLASVRGVVDEIVVVDGGSSDATVAIAEAAGARVCLRPWDDDFAAARNAAAAAATGDWILVLDADERLAPGAGEALRAAVEAGGFVLGLLPLHNAARLDAPPADVLTGRARLGEAVWLPRLLRRLPDLAWRGRIHESVADWIVRHGSRARAVEAPIVHLGAVPALRAARGKDDRNRRLLELECAASPDSVQPWAHLALERERAEDPAGAAEALERGWAAASRALARGERPALVLLATHRAQQQLRSGDLDGALATVAAARAGGPDHPNLCWLAGTTLVARGDVGAPELRRALEWSAPCAEEVLDGVRGWRSQLVLASALLEEDPAEALVHARAAFAALGSGEARLLLAEALGASGQLREALALLESCLLSDDPDAWAAAALVARRGGDLATAQALAGRVRGAVAPRRARALNALRAELAFRAGRVGPAAGPWGTITALVGGRPLARPEPVPEAVLLEAASVLLEREDERGLETLLSARAGQLVPGGPARVAAWLEEQGLRWVDDGEDFVFVGGAGRSGTTLFRAMLAAHPRLWCGPERKLVPTIAELHQGWARDLGADLAEAGVGAEALDAAAHDWLVRFLRAGVPEGRRIAEKTPHNVLHAAWLGRIFPRARFIHVIRDGRAVAESLVRQRWVDPATGAPVWYCADVTQAARYWASVVAEGRQQGASLPGRYLELRYEDLVADARGAMERVLAFLGEPWDDAVLHHDDARVGLSARESSSAAVARARTTDRVGLWREVLGGGDLRAIEHEAGPVLAAVGY